MQNPSIEFKEFILESYRVLDQLERGLAAPPLHGSPEKSFSDAYGALRAFRQACGSRGLQKIEGLAQAGELILSRLDQGQIYPQPQILGFLLNRIEDLRKEITYLETSGIQPPFHPASSPAVQNFPLNPLPWLQKTLIFRTPDDGRMAIPFDNVMRLEPFTEQPAGEKVPEGTGNQWMPLVDISRMLPERRLVFRRPPVRVPKGQTRQKIVYVTPQG